MVNYCEGKNSFFSFDEMVNYREEKSVFSFDEMVNYREGKLKIAN
jgi:hypothetical protein